MTQPKPIIPEANKTAFALGETEHLDVKALKAVQTAYETDAEVRSEVDAIRETASLLGKGWQNELTMTPALDLEAKPESASETFKFPGFFAHNKRLWLPSGLAAAAAVLLATYLIPALFPHTPITEQAIGLNDRKIADDQRATGTISDAFSDSKNRIAPLTADSTKEAQHEIRAMPESVSASSSSQLATRNQEVVPSPSITTSPDHSPQRAEQRVESTHQQARTRVNQAVDDESIAPNGPASNLSVAPADIQLSQELEAVKAPSTSSSLSRTVPRFSQAPQPRTRRGFSWGESNAPFDEQLATQPAPTTLNEGLALGAPDKLGLLQLPRESDADVIPEHRKNPKTDLGWSMRQQAQTERYEAAERYETLIDQPFYRPSDQPLSTFSVDVDTASYANARRFIENGALPPKDSVRVEEFINAFDYAYAQTVVDAVTGNTPPLTSDIETARCPWNDEHRLLRIGLKGIDVDLGERPVANLVFLIDVSGSMRDRNKLDLVKQGLIMLTESLNPSDRVSIVTYANGTQVALPSTSANEPGKIIQAIEKLSAGGSTNGADGLALAYTEARKHALPGAGINRVILCTDGDFNVGPSSTEGLTDLVQANANRPDGPNINVSVFGFGRGNLNDAMLESITNHGNGVYGYIPDEQEARKQFVDGLTGQLFTIAKDVKVQVEFNPAAAAGYRLIGYANRMLQAEDFNNDRVDAGDIGAGHTVTALYEIIPAGLPVPNANGGTVDPLRYQQGENTEQPELTETPGGDELAFVKVRYKHPDAKAEPGTSKLLTFPVKDSDVNWPNATRDFRFAAAVAAFGETLRENPNRGRANLDLVLRLADSDAVNGNDQRLAFRQLVEKAKGIAATPVNPATPATPTNP